jgi:signal transduction histidine kinase
MRERLVAALVGTVLVVVTAMAVVRAYTLAGDIQHQARTTLDRSASMAVAAVDDRLAAGRTVTGDFLDRLADGPVAITYRSPAGDTVSGGVRIRPSDEEYAATRPLAPGGTLTVVRPSADVAAQISHSLLQIVLLALVLVVLAALAGWWLSRQLARPFQELAVVARALARGRTDVRVAHYSVVEAEAIGTALRDGLARLDGLLDREREFAVSASHELRSPITALRLQVEGLGLHPDLPADARSDVDDVLRGLDRLAAAVRDVLNVARIHRDADGLSVDAGALVAEAVDRVTPRRARRRVERRIADGVLLHVPADTFTDVVTALVTDCLRHGSGAVLVELSDRGSHVELAVADEGARRCAPDVLHAETHAALAPADLAPALAAAEALGARVMVDDARTHRYRLLLPRTTSAAPGPAAG